MREIKHDGHARHTLVREKVKCTWEVCGWCGGHSARGNLYRYGFKRDADLSGRVLWLNRFFCCINCMRAYHGE